MIKNIITGLGIVAMLAGCSPQKIDDKLEGDTLARQNIANRINNSKQDSRFFYHEGQDSDNKDARSYFCIIEDGELVYKKYLPKACLPKYDEIFLMNEELSMSGIQVKRMALSAGTKHPLGIFPEIEVDVQSVIPRRDEGLGPETLDLTENCLFPEYKNNQIKHRYKEWCNKSKENLASCKTAYEFGVKAIDETRKICDEIKNNALLK